MLPLNPSKIMRLATVNAFENEKSPYITNIDGTILKVHDAPMIRVLSQGLGIPFNIVIAEDDLFGHKKLDGTWTGIIGLLVKGEAAITVTGVTASKDRREVVNFTSPLYLNDVTFMTNKPEPYPKAFAIFETFSFDVWIGVGLSLILTSILLYYLLEKRKSFVTVFMAVFGNILEKSFTFQLKRKNTVSLLVFWFLGITVLTSSYKSVILSVLTFPRLVGIRDISDLGKACAEGSVTCMSYAGNMPMVRWFETNDDRLMSIGESLRRSEMKGLTSQDAFSNYSKKKAFIADKLDLLKYEKEYFISQDSFSLSPLGIAYTKTFCCPRKLESVVHRIATADLYAKTIRDRYYIAELRLPLLNANDYEETKNSPLSLTDLTGAFLLLLAGYVFSCIVFLIEVLFYKTKKT